MHYKLNEKIRNSGDYVRDILEARGIIDVEEYLNPSKEDLLSPNELRYIDKGAKMLIEHLENNSKIYVVVD